MSTASSADFGDWEVLIHESKAKDNPRPYFATAGIRTSGKTELGGPKYAPRLHTDWFPTWLEAEDEIVRQIRAQAA